MITFNFILSIYLIYCLLLIILFFFESLVLELQKERESLKHEIESLDRESGKKLKFKDLEIEELSSQLEELSKSKDSKKKKMSNLSTVFIYV